MSSDYPKKDKPNFFDKNLIFEPKIDDTKLYKNMQNKANWKIDPMTITKALTRYYNRMDTWCRGKNKAKTKPNKANLLLENLVLRPVLSAVERAL